MQSLSEIYEKVYPTSYICSMRSLVKSNGIEILDPKVIKKMANSFRGIDDKIEFILNVFYLFEQYLNMKIRTTVINEALKVSLSDTSNITEEYIKQFIPSDIRLTFRPYPTIKNA